MSLRQLLHARRVDLREEQHMQRHLSLRPRRGRSLVVASDSGSAPRPGPDEPATPTEPAALPTQSAD
ncbi:hypothetical protein ACFYM2_05400 [Streptomyces sp. NPDC006711]|uniref:hypothetical protein n=1 Tax=Streptomyces sp. NPDC006711 TaxID=3364762 RepID=UPI0036C4A922